MYISYFSSYFSKFYAFAYSLEYLYYCFEKTYSLFMVCVHGKLSESFSVNKFIALH